MWANQEESDSNHFSFPFRSEAGQWTGLSKTQRQISVAPVWSKVIPNIPEYSEETEMDLFIWLPTEISGIFGIIEHTRGLHLLMHCSMASEVMESFPLFFYFHQLGRC